MSVMEHLYPQKPRALVWDALFPALQMAAPGVVLVAVEPANRKTPDWASMLLKHSSGSHFATLVVCSKPTQASLNDLRLRYSKNRNLELAQRAKVHLWSQLKVSKESSLARFTLACEFHYAILLAIVKLSNAVIDLPENEKLYSAIGFARHIGALQRSQRRGG